MGILGKVLTIAVAEKVGETALYGAGLYMEGTRSVDALVSNSTSNYVLVFKKNGKSIKRGYTVTDEFNHEKYIIKTTGINYDNPYICLCDLDENEIGKVKRVSEFGRENYKLFLDNEELGSMKLKFSAKINMDVNFNGWHLEGNIMQNSFNVRDQSGRDVIKFDNAYGKYDSYVLEVKHQEHEIMGLLLVLVVELVLHGKRDR